MRSRSRSDTPTVRSSGPPSALTPGSTPSPGRSGRSSAGRSSVALMLAITAVFGIGFFFLLPLFIASVTTSSVDNGLVQHLFEGLIRVALLLGYLVLISRSPDIHRVFQHHGAEHMTIHALEAGDPLTVGEVRKYPTAHQRCGTEFLVIV